MDLIIGQLLGLLKFVMRKPRASAGYYGNIIVLIRYLLPFQQQSPAKLDIFSLDYYIDYVIVLSNTISRNSGK
jgi:hypothetical protein